MDCQKVFFYWDRPQANIQQNAGQADFNIPMNPLSGGGGGGGVPQGGGGGFPGNCCRIY